MADVTEVHHSTELMESINEINYVDTEVNGPTTNEVLHKETLTLVPPNSSFMFHKDLTPILESCC